MMKIRQLRQSTANLICSGVAEPNYICWKAEIESSKLSLQSAIQVEQDNIALVLLNQQICAIVEAGSFPLDWLLPEGQMSGLHTLQVYYFSRKTFSDQRFGTPSPLLIPDPNGHLMSLRIHGSFAYQVDNPKTLWRQIPMGTTVFSTGDLLHPLRSVTLTTLSEYLSHPAQNIMHLLQHREQINQDMQQRLAVAFKAYGVTLNTFLIQSISGAGHE